MVTSHFMVHSNAFNNTIDRIKRYIGFKLKQGCLMYLGCPLIIGRPRIIYFANLVKKLYAGSQVGKRSNSVMGVGKSQLRMYFKLSLSTYCVLSPHLPQPFNKSNWSWLLSLGNGKTIGINIIGHHGKTWVSLMMKGVWEWGTSKMFAWPSYLNNGGSLGLQKHFWCVFLKEKYYQRAIQCARNGTLWCG